MIGEDEPDSTDEGGYVPGDADHAPSNIKELTFRHSLPGPQMWSALNAQERIAMFRWLKHGDAETLLVSLARNTSAVMLRGAVLEGLSQGLVTGWGIVLASNRAGGAPSKANIATIQALREALMACDPASIGTLALRAAKIVRGKRTRRGRVQNALQSAMVGLEVQQLRDAGSSYKEATFKIASRLTKRRPIKGGHGEPHNIKNIERLYESFLRIGKLE